MSLNEKLESLYPNTKVYGPYTSNEDYRQRMVFRETREDGKVVKGGKSFSMSHARALLTVEQNRILDSSETADHVDEDKTNDNQNNIQSLTLRDNIRKHVISKQGFIRKEVAQKCMSCGGAIYSSKEREFCSKSCTMTSLHRKREQEGNPITPPLNYRTVSGQDQAEMVRRLNDGQSRRSIAREMGFNKTTVDKYCKGM